MGARLAISPLSPAHARNSAERRELRRRQARQFSCTIDPRVERALDLHPTAGAYKLDSPAHRAGRRFDSYLRRSAHGRRESGGVISPLELVPVLTFSHVDLAVIQHGGAEEATVTQLLNQEAVLHVRFDGRSLDIPLGDLDVGTATADREIKRALARHLEVAEGTLRDYTVDRHETGNLTVRPEAVFG
jgi:hypothetical protein